MSLKLIVTKDGSHTIEGAGGVTYHSTFGALQESRHIFIRHGLHAVTDATPIRIFEMGLGTGLNAFLSLAEAMESGRPIRYEAVENKPLPAALIKELNFGSLPGLQHYKAFFERLHSSPWETPVLIHPTFTFYKSQDDGRNYQLKQTADLVYYDAFDPVVQPDLWTPEVFGRLYRQLNPGAILVTYCCKGIVQRALRSAGFTVEKLPGPPGKREMLRARKPAAS